MPLVDLAIDLTTGGRLIENGEVVMAVGARAVAQWIWAKLNTFKGEWRLNPKYGLDDRLLMRKPTDKALLDAHLRVLIASVPGVLAILEFATVYDFTTRTLTLTALVLVEGDEQLEFTALTAGGGWTMIIGVL